MGATEALVMLDAVAVEPVSKLVCDDDTEVALKAQEILSRIGPAALPFVWTNYRNASNEQLQRVSRKIFSDMPTERIKDELIRLLLSEDRLNIEEVRRNIEMAMMLLLERILVEDERPPSDQKMIAALLTHVQTHARENTNLRVIALLLLQRKDVVIRHLLPILHTDHQEWLTQLFLLLGLEGGHVATELWNILQSQDTTTPHQLRREVAGVMGLLGLDVGGYATTLSNYSYMLESQQAGLITRDFQKIKQQREGLEIALRALGGLLAGGKWNTEKLQDLLRNSQEGSPAHELYSVLLGKQFSGQIEQHAQRIRQLEQEIRNMREEHRKQIVKEINMHDKEKQKLNNTILQQMNQISTLTQDAIKLKQERDTLQIEVMRLRQP